MEGRKDLYREEKLSDAVRKFRCLYDKNDKHYKDRNFRQNAWNEVAKEMGFSSEADAEAHWVNLRTRFTRQRKTANIHGNMQRSSSEEHESRPNLDVYHLLSWLDGFVLSRKRLSAMDRHTAKVEELGQETEEESEMNQLTAAGNLYPETAEENPDEERATQVIVKSRLVVDKIIPETVETKQFEERYEGKKAKLSSVVSREQNKTHAKIDQLPKLKTYLNRENAGTLKRPEIKDEDDIFGELIASQLKKLSEHNRLQAKHQINNLMFQIQIEQLSASPQCPSSLNIMRQPQAEDDNCPCNNEDMRYPNASSCYSGSSHYVRVLDDPSHSYSTKDTPSPSSSRSPTEFRQGYILKRQKTDTR